VTIGASGLLALAACASVADLDVNYVPSAPPGDADAGAGADGGEDAQRRVRESSVEPTDVQAPVFPASNLAACDAGLGEEAGCDDSAGLGCCLTAQGATCIEQREAPALCAGNVFVACRTSVPDSLCCWRNGPKGHFAVYAADCAGGRLACLDDTGCAEGVSCVTKQCGTVNPFTIGECGGQPVCPGEF
jgi:hypothetical protein